MRSLLRLLIGWPARSDQWQWRFLRRRRGAVRQWGERLLPPSFRVPRVPPRKMAAAVRGAEELELLERLLGLPGGNKYGVQGERKVKGARRGLERVVVEARVGGRACSGLLSPMAAFFRTSLPASLATDSPQTPTEGGCGPPDTSRRLLERGLTCASSSPSLTNSHMLML